MAKLNFFHCVTVYSLVYHVCDALAEFGVAELFGNACTASAKGCVS